MLERVWRARDRVWRLGEGDVGGDGVRAALEWPALLRKLERVDPVCRQAEAALSDQPGARGRVTTRPTPQWTLRRTATRRRIICWKSPICSCLNPRFGCFTRTGMRSRRAPVRRHA